MIRKSLLIIFILLAVDALIFGTSSSHPGRKADIAKSQIDGLQGYYVESATYKSELLNAPQLDNAVFVSITKLDPSVYKRNEKGEVLDPWGQPYIIRRENDKIIITSLGLDRYNKLSSFQKWWSRD